jgi:hypothetical protein
MLYIHADVVLVTHKSHLLSLWQTLVLTLSFPHLFFTAVSKTFYHKRTLAEAAPEPAFAQWISVRITRHQVERPASSLASYQVGYVNKLLPYAVNAARGITFLARIPILNDYYTTISLTTERTGNIQLASSEELYRLYPHSFPVFV